MNVIENTQACDRPEGYSPKDRPVILKKAEESVEKNIREETAVRKINGFCSIVDRPEMNIVGVKVAVTPHCDSNAVDIVKRYIQDGTCALLEALAGNKHPGSYVAAATDIKTGIEFTYIIGVEVDDFSRLPPYLPPNTVTHTCPAARYGKVTRDIGNPDEKHADAKQAICYLASSEFRKASSCSYDTGADPFRVFDRSGEMTQAYEPVVVPGSDEERFAQVGYDIVTLPEIHVAGCTGEGDTCMFRLFELENSIDWKAAGCVSEKQYFSFGYKNKNGEDTYIFGRQVTDCSHVPEPLEYASVKPGLWVRLRQMQINNDDPSIFFEGAKEVVFFSKHPEFEEDYSERAGLYVAQFEQGACYYFPIRFKRW